MANPFKDSFRGSVSDYDPYHDLDDSSMKPKQFGDLTPPALNSPRTMSDSGTPRATHQSFRSSVGLIPTPGTVSRRHPTYVRQAVLASIGADS